MATTEEGAIRDAQSQRAGARHDPRLEWWRDAKFGMFIHWGLYAIPAGEWQGKAIPGIGEWIMLRARIPVPEYEALATRFDPVRFDAAAWVSLAKRAGQKYLVITAKHHDGFCMFHTKVGRYNIMDATPFGRDPLQELAAECARQGVKLGFYYSQTQDWHHPDGDGNDWDFSPQAKDFAGYLETYVKPQVRELLTNYGPICLIWFDTPKVITPEQSRSLVDLVHELQPDCLVNGRIGNALGDYAEARDNAIPDALVDADWETPATINDTWGYKKDDAQWKTPSVLIRKLVDSASKGGNFLLNVGPTAEGVIPDPSVERLLAVGEWLARNGESVYGTRSGPLQGLAWGRSTVKAETPRADSPRVVQAPSAAPRLYLHVFDWPAGGTLHVPLPHDQVRRAFLLDSPSGGPLREAAGGESPLPVSAGPEGLTVQGPATAPDAIDTVVVLELNAVVGD